MKITKTMHIHADRYCGEYEYKLRNADMSKYGHIYIGPWEVTFEVPDDFNPVPAEIAMLRKEKRRIRAEANVKANQIEEQISKLLAIEYKPEGV